MPDAAPIPSTFAGLVYPHGRFRSQALIEMIRRGWFVRLRWIILVATLAVLQFEHWYFPRMRRPTAVLLCVLTLAAVNLVWMLTGRRICAELDSPATEGEGRRRAIWRVTLFGNAQMTVDLLILTFILRYTGGVENPMAIFYLFHMLISALLLRPINALLQGIWALILYGGLAIGECAGWIAPHYPFLSSAADSRLHLDWTFATAGIGVLGAGIFGTLFFTLQISSRLDDQERDLQETIRALHASERSLRDVQAQRSRFMQTAAHQLKSPLATAETLAALLQDTPSSGPVGRDLVSRIIARCRAGIVQVDELLTLARIEQAPPARHTQAETTVRPTIEQVARRHAEQATAKRIQFDVQTTGCGDACVAVDSRDLEDCVSNLVDNAIKYTPQGGSVTVTATAENSEIQVVVADNGMGIAETSEDDIFDPFRRGRLALEAGIPGTGLGLAIVREVARQAGGRVTFRSKVGKGTEFELHLPRSVHHVEPDSPSHGVDPAHR